MKPATPWLVCAPGPGGPADRDQPVAVGDGFLDEGEIGEDGAATIRRVLDVRLRRSLALKAVAPRLAGRPAHGERLVREAQVLAQLDHPCVPPIHSLGFDARGRPYLLLKLVDGQTLRDRVRARAGHLDDRRVLGAFLGVFLRVCEAVAFAHSRNIRHGDIKPTNILVGAFGEVYLVNWSGGTRGTPAYMAPEQAAGRPGPLGAHTDVFGLGTVLYFIATGVAPFEGRDAAESLERARQGCLSDPRRLQAVGPPALQRVIRRAIAPGIQDRPPGALALRDEVEGLLFSRLEARGPPRRRRR